MSHRLHPSTESLTAGRHSRTPDSADQRPGWTIAEIVLIDALRSVASCRGFAA